MPLIYTNAVYTVLFVLCYVAWSLSESLGPGRWHGPASAQKRDRGSLRATIISCLLGVALAFLFPLLLPATTITANQPTWFFAGIVVILLGTALRWWAIRILAHQFTGSVTILENHQLITNGPYRLIRHPSYTGILLVVVGLGLMMNNWASLLALVTGLLVGLIYRMSVEEQVLRSAFGEDYERYSRRTKRVIPFVF